MTKLSPSRCLLFLLAAIVAPPASALGLGEVTLRSALNQPFDAQVPLLKATAEDMETARVDIRPAAPGGNGSTAYRIVQDLRHETVTLPDGNVALHLSSTQGIREPAFDLVIEVTLPHARVARQFSVLLDPPAHAALPHARAAAMVSTAATTASVAAPPPAQAAFLSEKAAAAGRPGSYGLTLPNETLWKIAAKVKPDAAIDTASMVAALHRANPHAFIAGDANRLKVWAMLRVPDRDEVLAQIPGGAPAPAAPAPLAGQGAQPLQVVEAPPASVAAQTVEPIAAAPAAPQLSAETIRSRERLEALKAEVAALEARAAQRSAAIAALSARLEKARAITHAPSAKPAEKPAAVATAAIPAASVPALASAKPPAAVEPATKRPALLAEVGATQLVLGIALLLGCAFAVTHRLGVRRKHKAVTKQQRAMEAELISAVSQKATHRAQLMEEMASVIPLSKRRKAAAKREKPQSERGGVETVLREVDLHLAYQHFEQAQARLEKALAERPDEPEFEIKLADVYLQAGNHAAFLRKARALHERPEIQSSAAWRRLYAVGKEFFPDRPPFAESVGHGDGHSPHGAQIYEFTRK